MRPERPRIAVYGLGAVGTELVRQLLDKKLSIVGVIVRDPALEGRSLAEVTGLTGAGNVNVTTDAAGCLNQARPDVVLHATSFDAEDTLRQLETIARSKANAVSVVGITHLWRRRPDLANALDSVARSHGTSILSGGLVPGFLSEALPIAIAGGCHLVTEIEISRVTDLSPWGPGSLGPFGFGESREDFHRRVADGELGLFAELWQSIDLIAAALGWELPESGEEKECHVTDRLRRGAKMEVSEGRVHGIEHRMWSRHSDGRRISVDFKAFIDPQEEAEMPRTHIRVRGEPGIEVAFGGDLLSARGALLTTCARMVNAIPHVIQGPPGLLSLADIPLMAPYRSGGG